jgi:phage major head subunit gpT-like protein
MIINRANLQVLFTAFNVAFNQAFEAAPTLYNMLAMTVPSSTTQNQYAWLGRTTRFREWLGDRQVQNLSSYDFAIKNKTFENTVGVEREVIEDDQFGLYTPMLAQLGQDAKQHPDELVFELLRNGHTRTCYDGQFFFDTDHPVVNASGGTDSVANDLGGAGTTWYLLDNSRMIKPFIFQTRRDYAFQAMDKLEDEAVFSRKEFRYGVDARVNAGYGLWQMAVRSRQTLDETQLQAAIAAMENFKGDNGQPLNLSPTHLIVPPALKYTAKKLVEAANNAAGATNVMAGDLKVLSTQRAA